MYLCESEELKIYKTSDVTSLIQRVCESVIQKVNSNETEYHIQCVLCTCQLDKAFKKRILKNQQENQKMVIAAKKKVTLGAGHL